MSETPPTPPSPREAQARAMEKVRAELATLVAGQIARRLVEYLPGIEDRGQGAVNIRFRIYRADNGRGEMRCSLTYEEEAPPVVMEYRVDRPAAGAALVLERV